MLPILSALAKVALSPLLFLLKYNRHICLCDNLFSLILWIVTGYITAQRSLEAQLAVFRRVHHAERSSEKSFPSWLRNKCPSLVYEVVAIESTDGFGKLGYGTHAPHFHRRNPVRPYRQGRVPPYVSK